MQKKGVEMSLSEQPNSILLDSDLRSSSSESTSSLENSPANKSFSELLQELYVVVESKIESLNVSSIDVMPSGLFLQISDKIVVGSQLHLAVSGKDYRGNYVEKAILVTAENENSFKVECTCPEHLHTKTFLVKTNEVLASIASFFMDESTHAAHN